MFISHFFCQNISINQYFFSIQGKQADLEHNNSSSYYVSQITVETYCFADGGCLLKKAQSVIYHWNQYDEEISKKCGSIRPSVCNANKKKPTPPLLIVDK